MSFSIRVRHALPILGLILVSGCDRSDIAETPVKKPEVVADTVYRGGAIITADDDQPFAEAVAVKDGKILAVGTLDSISDFQGVDTVVVDLDGRTLAPGFVDGHAHVAQFGLQAMAANLLAAPDGKGDSIDDLLAELKGFAAGPDVDRTGWIVGLGYDDTVLAEGRHPTRDDLDKVSTELPVIAVHISGHFSAVNSKGLELFGYDAESEDPPGGVIRRRQGSDEPNGVLEELASIPLVLKHLTPKTSEDAVYIMQKGIEMAMSFGYTTAQEGRAFASIHELLSAYAENVGFPIDVVSYIDYTEPGPLESAWHQRDYKNGYRVGGMKVTLDGSPQGRTAWRTQPYLIPPDGLAADYAGYPAISDDEANAAVELAYRRNWQVLVHANGDAAIDQFLEAVDSATAMHGKGDRRTTLIHGQYVRDDQLDKMAELDITASLFPMHTFYWGDWHKQIIGEQLGEKISPTRSALNRGLAVTSHSDAPVARPNLMQVMWATVNRLSRSGVTIGADEQLSPEEAFKAITIWSARQHFEEYDKGSIKAGKRADLVILSDNPLSIAKDRINKIVVLETIKDGESVWRRAD